MSNKLSDPDFLFSILTAIVKKSGGSITIAEKELKNISKGDLLGMYYEPKTGDLILKEVEPICCRQQQWLEILKTRLMKTSAKNIYQTFRETRRNLFPAHVVSVENLCYT